MKVHKAAAVLALMSAGSAQADLYNPMGDNNPLDDALDLGSFGEPGGNATIVGMIDRNDVDWFQFTVTDTASISVSAVSRSGDGADGILQIVADGGDVIGFDDDSGVGFMPALQLANLPADTYFVGLSGFGDVFWGSVDTDELADGNGHFQSFGYELSIGITIVPAPGALALLGVGGLVIARRRR